MAKMMVFIAEQNKKTTCFGLYRPSSGFDNFFVKESYINKISISPRGLGIYIRLFNKEVVKT